MARFVLLYHDCPPNYARASHWDFMLETGDVLRTWALERLPCDWQAAHLRTASIFPNCPPLALESGVAAARLGDHRLDYLEFEGPLSGDRGTVVRVAAGTYRSDHDSPGETRVVLSGDNFAANVQLLRSEADEHHWEFLNTKYEVRRTQC
jgi:hypothetical protein